MSKYTVQELGDIIAAHKKWITGEAGGRMANLYGANLSRAGLCGADLSRAYLYRADLSKADLSGADLSGANLCGANLSGAILCGADLSGADLSRATLCDANLSGADLSGADLYGANLRNIGGREVNTFVSVSGIGREGRQTLFWVEEDKIWCGCFTGTMTEFEAKVQDQHGDNIHGQNYRDAIAFFKSVIGRLGKKEIEA